MEKKSVAFLLMVFVLMITGCGNSNSADDEWVEQVLENVSTEGVADYPAAIMVNNTIYLMGDTPMSEKVEDIENIIKSFRR